MKIYLAARYSNRVWMQEVARELKARGHVVTSRWHGDGYANDECHQWDGVNRERALVLAEHDRSDIRAADALILFTPPGRNGGCNVEFGFAEGLGKMLYIVGPCQNVFHALAWPAMDWRELVNALPLDPFNQVCAESYASAKEAGR